MLIRHVNPSDAASIAEIYNSAIEAGGANAYTEALPFSHFQNLIADHPSQSYPMLVAEEEGEVLGMAYISPYRCGRKALAITAEISFYVSDKARGKGVATKLINEIEKLSPELGIESLFGIILDTNTPSINLMKKLGYSQWAHLPKTARFGGKTIGQVYFGKNLV